MLQDDSSPCSCICCVLVMWLGSVLEIICSAGCAILSEG
jgi:hypothetical protein